MLRSVSALINFIISFRITRLCRVCCRAREVAAASLIRHDTIAAAYGAKPGTANTFTDRHPAPTDLNLH